MDVPITRHADRRSVSVVLARAVIGVDARVSDGKLITIVVCLVIVSSDAAVVAGVDSPGEAVADQIEGVDRIKRDVAICPILRKRATSPLILRSQHPC